MSRTVFISVLKVYSEPAYQAESKRRKRRAQFSQPLWVNLKETYMGKIRFAFCSALLAAGLLTFWTGGSVGAPSADPQVLKRQIGYAEHYVKEFENEVARQRGGEKMVWRSKQEALSRVQQLKTAYPDDPDVEKLYQRVRAALMKSKGEHVEAASAWTLYKRNEDNLRKLIAEEGKKAWEALLQQHKDKLIENALPAPDSTKVTVDGLKGTYVLLSDVQYPGHQFYGATGEYVYVGKPSSGYYFVKIDGRDWLGPYEAVKRYRRNVDATLADVTRWTVLGEIVDIIAEIPQAGGEKTGSFQYGWVVRPVALYVPGHVMAVQDSNSDVPAGYVGEERVNAIKDGWYTVKDIPADVSPDRLMEIFMTSIKEKNYSLYENCIDPERRKSEMGKDLLRYHWDLHQERFHGEYVHAAFGKPKIRVVKGFDDGNELENFFLDESQKEALAKRSGVKIEEAVVESRAFDEKGKQIGSPHEHRLIRKDGGRWYVKDYEPRF